MGKWADSARHEDISTLKSTIVKYIPYDPVVTSIHPPLPDNKKFRRGFNHPETGYLLTPQSFLYKLQTRYTDKAEMEEQ